MKCWNDFRAATCHLCCSTVVTTDICTLNETDVTNAEEIALALKPIRDATHIMSEDSTPTLSIIALLRRLLTHKLT